MQPNIWLMPLLHDARGWGQQTVSPAFLTSGRGQIEKEGMNMNINVRWEEDKKVEKRERWRDRKWWKEDHLTAGVQSVQCTESLHRLTLTNKTELIVVKLHTKRDLNEKSCMLSASVHVMLSVWFLIVITLLSRPAVIGWRDRRIDRIRDWCYCRWTSLSANPKSHPQFYHVGDHSFELLMLWKIILGFSHPEHSY